MNTGILRAEYDKLTPFQKAVLLTHEAVGKRRDVETLALEARTPFELLKMNVYQDGFFTVAAVAMFRALWADRLSLLGLAGVPESDNEAMRQAGALRLLGAGWLRALQRIEAETGAPLMDAARMLDEEYGAELLDWAEGMEIDDSRQYAVLRKLYDAFAPQGGQK